MSLTETVFRLWFCCVITSIGVSASIGLGFTLYIENRLEKKKAHLGRGEQGDVINTSSNLHY